MSMNTHKLWLQQLQDQYNKRMSDGRLTEDEMNKKMFTDAPMQPRESVKSLQEAIAEVQGQDISEIIALKMASKLPGAKGAIDAVQKVGDVVSTATSVIPGANLIGSAIDAASAAVDTAQGDYGDAMDRGIGAAAGLVPGGKLAKVGGKALVKGARAIAASTEYDEENALLEEIAYLMIEDLEEQIGRNLSPEEIEEFIENNYDKIESTYQDHLNENSSDKEKPLSKGRIEFEYSSPISKEANNRVTANANKGDKDTGVGANAPEQPSSKPLPKGKVLKAKGTGPKRVGGDAY